MRKEKENAIKNIWLYVKNKQQYNMVPKTSLYWEQFSVNKNLYSEA